MADRSDPKPLNSPAKSLGNRDLARAPSKLDSSPAANGPFHRLPATFGRFRVLRLLGNGAMGSVYLAFDPEMDREVALKIPKADLAQEPILWERFRREARAAGDLNHPYICGMYEVGQIGAVHFFSMEYVQGRPLKDYISDRQPQRKVAGVVRKLALGLAHAHDMGIVHRDLKPLNIMIDRTGEPKLMDFGLVRRLDMDSDTRATQAGVILGSPGYMAPEQALADHDRVGPATDIYGLGVVMFELLTGTIPFNGTVMQVLTQIATQPPPRPSSLRPDVDPQLEDLCLRMLAKDPQDRPNSMLEIAQTLSTWMKSGGAVPIQPNPEPEPAPTPPVSSSALVVTRNETVSATDIQKRQLSELLLQRQYSLAIAMLEKMTQPGEERSEKMIAWAVQELARVRAEALENDPIARAFHEAEQKFREFDYAGAVKSVEEIPAEDRDRKAQQLLQKSIELRDDCERLRHDIEQSIHATDFAALPEQVEELFKRQPTNASVRQLAADLKRFGARRMIAIRRCEDVGEGLKSILRWKVLCVAVIVLVALTLGWRGLGLLSQASANNADSKMNAESERDSSSKQPILESQLDQVDAESMAEDEGSRVELLDELTVDGSKRGLWVAPDALHIYWEHDKGNAAGIYMATRSSTNESFGKAESLFGGRFPTLSGDELTIVVTINEKLHISMRASRTRKFDAPELIEELKNSTHVKTPSLTADGLHLVWFTSAHDNEPKKIWISSRPAPTSTWSKAQELMIKDFPHVGSLNWPQLLDDGKTLLCNDESSDGKHRFVLLRREDRREPFRKHSYLEGQDIGGLMGRAPRYLAETDELYFLSSTSRELTSESGKKILKEPWEVFRLTRASKSLGREVCDQISDRSL